MRGMRAIGVSQRQSDSKRKEQFVGCVCSGVAFEVLGVAHSQIHLLSTLCRGKEIWDGAIGVTKVLFSVDKCSFDSGGGKAHPGFEFAAM
jgi:hypothetical protein